jgi:Photosynthetic reaction centre cytochrome C subunit
VSVIRSGFWCALTLIVAAATSLNAQAPAAPFDQAKALAELRKAIAGKEDEQAVDVFMNITQYKGVTAERLLRIMEYGFSRSLGVTCTHCHIPGEWESDDKGAKNTARAMSAMVSAINNDFLKNIATLNSANPSVNCTTCHRGQKRPALELPTQTPAAH